VNAQALNVYTTWTPIEGSSWGGDESLPATPCGNFQANNAIDVWYSFVATGTEHTVNVIGTNGTIPYIEMFSGMCDNLTSLGCATDPFGSEPLQLVRSGLTVGETYLFRVYSNFGAGTFDISVTGDIATSMSDAGDAAVPFSVFPNPSNGDMSIRFGAADSKVAIDLFDMAGRTVHQEQRQLFNGQQVDLGLAGKLAPGVYTLRLTSSSGRSEQRVVVH
jgi:hypothetical protein